MRRRWLHSAFFDGGLILAPPFVSVAAVPQTTHSILDAWLWKLEESDPGLRSYLFPEAQKLLGRVQGKAIA